MCSERFGDISLVNEDSDAILGNIGGEVYDRTPREDTGQNGDIPDTTVRELLTEMKDISEVMVDLAYAAIMFDSEEIAEEVAHLEERMHTLNYEIRIKGNALCPYLQRCRQDRGPAAGGCGGQVDIQRGR